jgi:hypothetical protein
VGHAAGRRQQVLVGGDLLDADDATVTYTASVGDFIAARRWDYQCLRRRLHRAYAVDLGRPPDRGQAYSRHPRVKSAAPFAHSFPQLSHTPAWRLSVNILCGRHCQQIVDGNFQIV